MSDTNLEPGDSSQIPYGSAKFPTQEDPDGLIPQPGGLVGPGGRVEANTALLKIGRSMEEPSGEFNNNSGLMGFGSADGESEGPPAEFGDDQQSTEAASARIAQEYRRQVRIKRLAEEIQQAEKEKKKEEKRNSAKEGTTVRSSEMKRKEETAKISLKEIKEADPETEAALSKKRAEALNAFKGRQASSKWIVPMAMGLLLVGVVVGAVILYSQVNTANAKLKEEVETRTKKLEELAKAVDPKYAALENRMETERLAREQAEKAAVEERLVREETVKKQEEQARILREEREALLAEAKRSQEQAAKLEEENRKRNDELRRKSEEASRIAREKIKNEQQGTTTPVNAVAGGLEEVKTSPPQPVGVAGRDMPAGAVRLFCKASDPYGGRLTFHWKQLKGAPVEIADPNFSVMKDGKWYSQTYFIAREPGSYEFEVSVKNEDGVESLRKYPIEVLPVTTLKQ